MNVIMNIEKQLNNELQNSIRIQKDMQNIIDELTAENTFLSETIILHKLGQITIERKNLQSKINAIQNDAKFKLEEAQKFSFNIKILLLIQKPLEKDYLIKKKM